MIKSDKHEGHVSRMVVKVPDGEKVHSDQPKPEIDAKLKLGGGKGFVFALGVVKKARKSPEELKEIKAARRARTYRNEG